MGISGVEPVYANDEIDVATEGQKNERLITEICEMRNSDAKESTFLIERQLCCALDVACRGIAQGYPLRNWMRRNARVPTRC